MAKSIPRKTAKSLSSRRVSKRQSIRPRKKVVNRKVTKKAPLLAHHEAHHHPALHKPEHNPILSPRSDHKWESWQTFNPAAFLHDNTVHLIYRAMGEDGISRFGYATSADGRTILERATEPVFVLETKSPSPYVLYQYHSGGGLGGAEDPRVTLVGDTVYVVFVALDGMPKLALTSISLKDLLDKKWKWAGVKIISPPGVIDKSGCIFPEKINGKYAILHRVFPNILLDYVDDLDFKNGKTLKGEYSIKIRKDMWDSRKIGAGAPPIKTRHGWLLIYYGVDDRDSSKYKIGAMLLDLKRPDRVLARSAQPILEPVEWYENSGHKAGIAYPCGAVIKGGELFVYYGGADSYVCVAVADAEEFIKKLITTQKPKLMPLGGKVGRIK